jgi:iron(III) transport system ATP-binding protein
MSEVQIRTEKYGCARATPPDTASSLLPAVRLERVSMSYPGSSQKAVDELTLEIRDGEIFTLLGPSGCGKSTTLRIVAGLEQPDSGSIYFGDTPVVLTERKLSLPPEKRNFGMVFQSYAIWPHMTVEENVGYPLKAKKCPRAERQRRVAEVLNLVGMAGTEKRPGPSLSGGQQQRVALARALVTEPQLLLLDEPFSNLDAKLREQMRFELKQLQKRLKIAVLFVTHDQVEAFSLSDRIAIMNHGVVQQQGSPSALYNEPANEFVRDFVGMTLLFKGTAKSTNLIAIDGAPECVVFGRTYHPSEINTGDTVYIGVRPEDVEILLATSAELPSGLIGGKVHTALFTGDRTEYQIEVDGQKVMVIYGPRHNPIAEGSRIWLKIRSDGHSAWKSDFSVSPCN